MPELRALAVLKHIVADIETDDLLDKLTTVHSLVLRDLDSDTVISCADQEGYVPICEGLRVLSEAERVYWHNGIKFDFPALTKVFKKEPHAREKMRDTFVIASMRWAHQKERDYALIKKKQFPNNPKLAGSHSLKAWGYRLGILKGDFKYNDEGALAQWTPELQQQCEQDTAVTKALVLRIRQAGVSAEAVDIEHAVAWYLAYQERAGVPFDFDKAVALQAKLAARREEIAEKLRVDFGPLIKRDGKPVIPKRDNVKKGIVAGCEYQKIKVVDFNPGSRQHIEKKLKEHFDWKPTEFTPSGQAKIDEKTLSGLNTDIPAVKTLLEYLLVEKRLGQVSEGDEGWFRHMTTDGPEGGKLTGLRHIHGRVMQNKTITHRAAHSNPNLGQVPKVGKPFGAECRELFMVPPSAPDDPDGWVLVGADLAGLEARNLGHYLAAYDGGAFAEILLKGDPHTKNRIALGLPGDTDEIAKVARDGAKTWYYAWMFGGGDLKLGTILAHLKLKDGTRLIPIPEGGWTEATLKAYGKKRKTEFLKNTPALARLITDVRGKMDQGWIRMPDGRRTYIRSEHSALNTLIQSSGAVVAKRWIANFYPILYAEYGEPSWLGQWVPLLWVHDEVQIAVRRRHAERVCTILLEQIRRITEQFQWRIPLDGEAKVGLNWKETH